MRLIPHHGSSGANQMTDSEIFDAIADLDESIEHEYRRRNTCPSCYRLGCRGECMRNVAAWTPDSELAKSQVYVPDEVFPAIKKQRDYLWQACLGAAAVGVVIYLWWIGVRV